MNYYRYVDDTCLIFQDRTDALKFFDYMNQRHQNISFTMEEEINNTLSFLDVQVTRQTDGLLTTSVYRKPTFSGLFLKWDSYVPKQFKKSLVLGFINRAWKICSTYELFDKELQFMKFILKANGYPGNFLESCIHKALTKFHTPPGLPAFGPERKEVHISLPYCGQMSDRIKRQLNRMMATVAPWIKLRVVFKSIRTLRSLSKLKSKLPTLSWSKVVYQVNCSQCSEFYVGKTIRTLVQRLNEHASDINSALSKHNAMTGHIINYEQASVVATDICDSRLYVKEALKIRELAAYKSLNGNIGSMELKLW